MSRLQAHHWESTAPETGSEAIPARRVLLLALTALVALLTAACADDSNNRQFANEPVTPHPTATATVGTPQTAPPVAPAYPQASPETLVDRRGAPSVIYALVGGRLWAFDGTHQRQVTGDPVVAFAASPSGGEVATVSERPTDGGTAYSITVRAPDGETLQQFDDVLVIRPESATPVGTTRELDAVHLSWSPQGRRVLLSHVTGALVDVPFDGAPHEIATRTSIAGVIQAAWSPRGDQIGIVLRDSGGNGTLGLIDPSQDPAGLTVIAPVGATTDGEKSVEAFAWRPNGDGVLFLEGVSGVAGTGNAQLMSWDQHTNTIRVVATGGQGGPTGSISSFAIAPDGKAVAYTISILTGDGWSFDGLYVRSLRHGQVYRVPLPGDAAVTEVRWIRDGLAWAMQEDGGGISLSFRMVDGMGRLRDLGDVTLATPSASPVAVPASPAASPVAPATPAASPVPVGATPVGGTASPGASPVG